MQRSVRFPSTISGNAWLTNRLRAYMEQTLDSIDVRLDGSRPWDMQIHDQRLFARVLLERSVGAGDAYIDGWWDCDDIEELFYRLLSRRLDLSLGVGLSYYLVEWLGGLRNRQSRKRARMVADRHYDLPSDFYMSFLDPYNQYTCGFFQDTDDLAEAQEAKLDLICQKLQLQPGERVLDIGCGWGGFARFAAERYGVHVTGISISNEQLDYGRQFTRGLPVELRYCDYRDVQGTFDKVLVCGMIEHVGHKNYRPLMQAVHRTLADDGLFLLHTIGGNESVHTIDPWLDKHIFPNATLPSIAQLDAASSGLFVMQDWHNFRQYYVSTLRAWFARFDANWSQFAHKLGAGSERHARRLHRTWKYYFLSCAGIFRAGNAQLWQIVYTHSGLPRQDYISVRPRQRSKSQDSLRSNQ